MINGAWDVLRLIFVVIFWVETKGKTLEEIDELFDGVRHSNVDGETPMFIQGIGTDDVEVVDVQSKKY